MTFLWYFKPSDINHNIPRGSRQISLNRKRSQLWGSGLLLRLVICATHIRKRRWCFHLEAAEWVHCTTPTRTGYESKPSRGHGLRSECPLLAQMKADHRHLPPTPLILPLSTHTAPLIASCKKSNT